MKIYTFFEPSESTHSKENQLRLLSLWRDNWVDKGWEPVVLNNDYAEAHPFYEEFVKRMKSLHVLFTGQKLKDYGIYCYTRWLAYAMLESSETIYTCDYDLINNNLKPTMVKSNPGIHLMSEYCPCFVSGTSSEFLAFAKFFLYISELRYPFLRGNIKTISGMASPIYHDQDVLVNNLSNMYSPSGPMLAVDLNFRLSTNLVGQMASKRIYEDFVFKKKLPKTLHFSRNSMVRFKKDLSAGNMDDDVLRCNIIEEKFR
jgi:hypothetical protein